MEPKERRARHGGEERESEDPPNHEVMMKLSTTCMPETWEREQSRKPSLHQSSHFLGSLPRNKPKIVQSSV